MELKSIKMAFVLFITIVTVNYEANSSERVAVNENFKNPVGSEDVADINKLSLKEAAKNKKINRLLRKAEKALDEGNLKVAYDSFKEVQTLNPKNSLAEDGMTRVSDRYLSLAINEAKNNNFNKAYSYLALAKDASPAHSDLARMQRKIDRLKARNVSNAEKYRKEPPRIMAPMSMPPMSMPATKAKKERHKVAGGIKPKPMMKGGAEDYAVVDVFFATDREENSSADGENRFSAERGELKYGIVQVSIPHDHRMGELEAPSFWKLEFREDPEKHVVVLDIKVLEKSPYFKSISEKIRNSKQKSAFIFVHGYNVTFENAARRTGQMTYDLGFDGAPVLYSWPSHGDTAKYTFDEENIKWAKTDIEKFLKEFCENSDAEKIYLIAHSMGNRGLVRAYISFVNNNPELKSRFTEIILAAPDIDADTFKREIAPAMVQAGNPITLYASSRDIPLKASKKVHGGHPRAGDSGEDLIVFPGIESIDATNVKTGFVGHSYYAEGQSVISDIFDILNNGLRASKRFGLTEESAPNGKYWRFKNN